MVENKWKFVEMCALPRAPESMLLWERWPTPQRPRVFTSLALSSLHSFPSIPSAGKHTKMCVIFRRFSSEKGTSPPLVCDVKTLGFLYAVARWVRWMRWARISQVCCD